MNTQDIKNETGDIAVDPNGDDAAQAPPSVDLEKRENRVSENSENSETSESPSEETECEVLPYNHPKNFPEGGTRAWLQVLGGFAILFNSWGVTTTMGVFQAYYRDVLLTSQSNSSIAWIQSIQIACIFWGGTLTGRLFDAGYMKYLLAGGSAWTFMCYILIGECDKYWQLLLCQGFGMGLGMGATFAPSMACVSQYFLKNRGLAIGLCSSGAGIAGVVLPIAANNLFDSQGFRWTARILAFIYLGVAVVANLVLRYRVQPQRPPNGYHWFDAGALKNPVYVLFVVATSCAFLVLYIPYYYMQQFTAYKQVDGEVSKYVIAILCAGASVGRVVPPMLADTFGKLNIITCVALINGVLLLCWLAIENTGGVVAFAVIYGFFSGGLGTFPPFVLPSLSTDISKVGVCLGMAFMCLGLVSLVANPIAGAIVGNSDRYHAVAAYSGALMLTASGVYAAARMSKGGLRLERV